MSYDLMVFEPEAAPKDHESFLTWYGRQTKWNEGHSYNDPAITTKRLQSWLAEMFDTFPPMANIGPEDKFPEDEASLADYSIGKQIVYVAFAWSKEESAYRLVFDLAVKHNVGFFNVSSNEGEVWLPEGDSLKLAHQNAGPTLLKRINRLFGRA